MSIIFVDELPKTGPRGPAGRWDAWVRELLETNDPRWAVMHAGYKSNPDLRRHRERHGEHLEFCTRVVPGRPRTWTLYARIKAPVVKDAQPTTATVTKLSVVPQRTEAPAPPSRPPEVYACIECDFTAPPTGPGKTKLREHALSTHERPATAAEMRVVVA